MLATVDSRLARRYFCSGFLISARRTLPFRSSLAADVAETSSMSSRFHVLLSSEPSTRSSALPFFTLSVMPAMNSALAKAGHIDRGAVAVGVAGGSHGRQDYLMQAAGNDLHLFSPPPFSSRPI